LPTGMFRRKRRVGREGDIEVRDSVGGGKKRKK
jgi:hypothetical protein